MAAMKAKDDESVVVGLGHADLDDALTCALIAWLFHCQPGQLVQPGPDVDLREGWIFVPADGLVVSAG